MQRAELTKAKSHLSEEKRRGNNSGQSRRSSPVPHFVAQAMTGGSHERSQEQVSSKNVVQKLHSQSRCKSMYGGDEYAVLENAYDRKT